MPTVPRLSRVQQQAFPGVRVSTNAPAEAFGGGQAAKDAQNARERLSHSLLQALKQGRDESDHLMRQDLAAQGTRFGNSMIWDPENGVVTKKGIDAVGLKDEKRAEFEKWVNERAKEIPNERVKSAFFVDMRRQWAGIENQIDKHTYGEFNRYRLESLTGAIEAFKEDAKLNYQEPNRIAENLTKIRESIENQGKLEGSPRSAIELAYYQAESNVHLAVIQQMVHDGNSLEAQKHLALVNTSMLDRDRQAANKLVKDGVDEGKAQELADQIWDASENNLSRAMEMVRRQVTDPEIRKRTETLIDQKFSRFQANRREEDHNRYRSGDTYVRQHLKLPPWHLSLPPAERASLDALLKRLLSGENVTLNTALYRQRMDELAAAQAGNQVMLRKMMDWLPEKDHEHFPETEMKQLIKLRADLISGKKSQELDDWRSKGEILEDAMRNAGIDPSKNKTRVSELRERVADETRIEQDRLGRKLTNEEYQRIIDRQLMNVTTKKGWGPSWMPLIGDTKKRVYQLEEGDEAMVDSVDQIPRAVRRNIENVLRSRKIPITDQSVLNFFRLELDSRRRSQ